MSLAPLFRRTFGCLALLLPVFPLAAAIPLGPGELFLSARTSLKLDDNIFLTRLNKEDDMIATLTPGLEYRFGRGGATSGALSYSQAFSWYSSNSDQNSSLAALVGSLALQGPKTTISGLATFNQIRANQRDFAGSILGDNIRRDDTELRLSAEFNATPKFSVGTGIVFQHLNYRERAVAGFADGDTWTVPVNVYYKFRPKIDLSAGVQYRTTSTERANTDSDSWFFNVGARGELTPKLNADIRVGVESRSADNAPSDSTLSFNGTLSWAVSPKATVTALVGRRFDTSAFGTQKIRTNLNLNADVQFDESFSGSLGFGYENADYEPTINNRIGRDDNYYTTNAGLAYQINQNISLSVGYVLRANRSNEFIRQFSSNQFSLGATFRY